MDERYFLLEAKWKKDKLPASQIYEFQGKVEGKLLGTLGVFFSISGFSDEAPLALERGKAINILLFDGNDFEACIGDGFKKVLLYKMRVAAEYGSTFVPYQASVFAPKISEPTTTELPSISSRQMRIFTHGATQDALASNLPRYVVLCEGMSDVHVLHAFADQILADDTHTTPLYFIHALGKQNINRLAVDLASNPHNSKFILVADGEGDPEETEKLLLADLPPNRAITIVPEKRIEDWVIEGKSGSPADLLSNVGEVDLSELEKKDMAFRKFAKVLRKMP